MEEQECCGSGCNNCVLDQKIIEKPYTSEGEIKNVLDGNYKKFIVHELKKYSWDVYQFTFKFSTELEARNQEKYFLIIPPTSYLMMRTTKCERKFNPFFQDFKDSTKSAHPNFTLDFKKIDRHDKTTEDIYISRKYTPFQVDPVEMEFKILVKLEPFGEMSEYFQTLEEHDEVEFKGPYSQFHYNRNSYDNLVILTQGVSITSSLNLINEFLKDDLEETRLILISCYKNFYSILFRKEMQDFNRFWNFKSFVFLSKKLCSCTSKDCDCLRDKLMFKENILGHRLEFEDFQKILENFNPSKSLFLCCGRESYTNFVRENLLKLNFNNFIVL